MTNSNINLIIDRCNATGIDYDLHEGLIGFRFKGKHVWHWFKHLNGTGFLFEQSYSQNTGKVKRGIRHRFKVYDAIDNALGLRILTL